MNHAADKMRFRLAVAPKAVRKRKNHESTSSSQKRAIYKNEAHVEPQGGLLKSNPTETYDTTATIPENSKISEKVSV